MAVDARLLLTWIQCTLLICLMAGRSQEKDCHVFKPSEYMYREGIIENIDSNSDNCNTESMYGATYVTCNEPVRISDANPGPEVYNPTETSHYYRWTIGGGQMLITFPTEAQLESIILHYYVNRNYSIWRPKARLFLVDNSFQLNDTTPDIDFTIIERVAPPEDIDDGLHNETIHIEDSSTTSKVLLEVFSSIYNLVITELTFCSTESIIVSNTPSVSNSTRSIFTDTISPTSFTGFMPYEESEDAQNDTITNETSGQKQAQSYLSLIIFSLLLLLR